MAIASETIPTATADPEMSYARKPRAVTPICMAVMPGNPLSQRCRKSVFSSTWNGRFQAGTTTTAVVAVICSTVIDQPLKT
jgi:hypothetical protein